MNQTGRQGTAIRRDSTQTPGRRTHSYPYRLDLNLRTQELCDLVDLITEEGRYPNRTVAVQQVLYEYARTRGLLERLRAKTDERLRAKTDEPSAQTLRPRR